MFWASSAWSGAFDAGREGCVVSGSWMIACCSSGVWSTWCRSTVLSRFSGSLGAVQERRTSCPLESRGASHPPAAVLRAHLTVVVAGVWVIYGGLRRIVLAAVVAAVDLSVVYRGRLSALKALGVVVAGLMGRRTRRVSGAGIGMPCCCTVRVVNR